MTEKQAYALIQERVDEMRKHPDVQRKFMEKIRSGKSEKECVEWVYMMAFCTLFGPPKAEAKKEATESNIRHFSDFTPGIKPYTPELGERKPSCKMEARICHYGRHYYIDTTETLKGRGIEFIEKLTSDRLNMHGAYKTGWNKYRVTSRAFELLKDRYPIRMETLLD